MVSKFTSQGSRATHNRSQRMLRPPESLRIMSRKRRIRVMCNMYIFLEHKNDAAKKCYNNHTKTKPFSSSRLSSSGRFYRWTCQQRPRRTTMMTATTTVTMRRSHQSGWRTTVGSTTTQSYTRRGALERQRPRRTPSGRRRRARAGQVPLSVDCGGAEDGPGGAAVGPPGTRAPVRRGGSGAESG